MVDDLHKTSGLVLPADEMRRLAELATSRLLERLAGLRDSAP